MTAVSAAAAASTSKPTPPAVIAAPKRAIPTASASTPVEIKKPKGITIHPAGHAAKLSVPPQSIEDWENAAMTNILNLTLDVRQISPPRFRRPLMRLPVLSVKWRMRPTGLSSISKLSLLKLSPIIQVMLFRFRPSVLHIDVCATFSSAATYQAQYRSPHAASTRQTQPRR